MSILLHGDCLDELKGIDDNYIDLFFCDLPYGEVSCAWDKKINLEEFWAEIMRVKKLHTPIFFTTTTKYGIDLLNSAPKKLKFFDLVWIKSAPTGFLLSKKFPLRKHELVYVFYEKLPFYDLSSHKHKFIKERPTKRAGKDGVDNKGMIKNRSKSGMETMTKYDPPLPTSIIKEDKLEEGQTLGDKGNECYGNFSYYNNGVKGYDPPLPTSIIKEDKLEEGKPIHDGIVHSSGVNGVTGQDRKKPLRRCKKGDEMYYDPALPTSIIKEQECISGTLPKTGKGTDAHSAQYDPPLPTSLLEIKSTRGKHSTEKPVALIEWILKYYSKEGDVILDPTMGSGSTGVACKNMNRNFIGIELNPEIYEFAVNRIED